MLINLDHLANVTSLEHERGSGRAPSSAGRRGPSRSQPSPPLRPRQNVAHHEHEVREAAGQHEDVEYVVEAEDLCRISPTGDAIRARYSPAPTSDLRPPQRQRR